MVCPSINSPDIPKIAPAFTPDPKAASKAAAPAASPVMSLDDPDWVIVVVVFWPLEEVVELVVVWPDEEDDFWPDEDDFWPDVVESPDLLTEIVLFTWTSWSSPF